MSDSVVEPATVDDIRKFAGEDEYPTMKAWAGKVDGETVALGGLARDAEGRWIAFFDITDEARPHKKLIVKTGKMIMEQARQMKLRFVYAMPDCNEPLAIKWLGRLGFKKDIRSGVLMRWENGG